MLHVFCLCRCHDIALVLHALPVCHLFQLVCLTSTEVIQLVSLLYYICSHFPGGTSTLNLLGRMGGRSARAGLKKHLDDLEAERIVGFCCFAISVPTSSVAVYIVSIFTILQCCKCMFSTSQCQHQLQCIISCSQVL